MAKSEPKPRPNILLIMADEYRFPRYFKDQGKAGETYGMLEPIKHILGFQGGPDDIAEFERYFPGIVQLRNNAVVLRNHTIGATACVPSRAVLFTGQYGHQTGVKQTDGIFKDGNSPEFPWLKANGIPTLGDWFREAGYETHYFGKCHFANPPHHSLLAFGFDDWEKSYPEPHGTLVNNLGYYRDHGFADLVTTFLRGKGLALDYDRQEAEGKDDNDRSPWLAVASFTNPHDITGYPLQVGQVTKGALQFDTENEELAPLPIPAWGSRSAPPENGTWQLELNPDGFAQENANLPPNWNEDLRDNNKPDCQYDYSLKIGMAVASAAATVLTENINSALGSKFAAQKIADNSPRLLGLPFQLTKTPEDWSTKYLQYYTYLHHYLDQHINRIMTTLKETGLLDNTIVVFAPDHGDYGASHSMMIEKWHSAYQEAIHVPVVVCLPPGMSNDDTQQMRQIDQLTSHIDMVPTLLGLAGVSLEDRAKYAKNLKKHHEVPALIGADLSGLITGTQDGPVRDGKASIRKGVLFVTDDMITRPLLGEAPESYHVFLKAVNHFIHTDNPDWQPLTTSLAEGPVRLPCRVQCVRQEEWKLVRYFTDSKEEGNNQWELYNLHKDPIENVNLIVYSATGKDFPEPISRKKLAEQGFNAKEIKQKAIELRELLYQLVTDYQAADGVPGI